MSRSHPDVVTAPQDRPAHAIELDIPYLFDVLEGLISTPSPTGWTDRVVGYVGKQLQALDVPFELTLRGAIRATLPGPSSAPGNDTPARALVAHLDTLGALVKGLKRNGRLALVPVGTWSSRFAEGARVTIYCDAGRPLTGTILPLKASGHTFGREIDAQPVTWDNVEVRVDANVHNKTDLRQAGIEVGDFVAIHPGLERTPSGFINARHLDDKAGVAALLAVVKAVRDAKLRLPVRCDLLLTITEETGEGASTGLAPDVSELVVVDNGTPAKGQCSTETEAIVAMADSTGPFDYHLTRHLLGLCRRYGIPHQRDIFRHYRCDAAPAIAAGHDVRAALVCFGVDSSHGYERTHIDGLVAVARLVLRYLGSDLVARPQLLPVPESAGEDDAGAPGGISNGG